MFSLNSQFPHHTLLTEGQRTKHLLQVSQGNLCSFLPLPHHAGAPTYGPDRWLTVTGPGADGSLQNFTIHHAALAESNLLNRINLPAFFQLDALQDVDGFAKVLLNPEDPVAQIIRSRLPELDAWDGASPITKGLASRIVTELNRLVRKPEKLSRIPFVDPPVGSFALGLAENPNPAQKDRALFVKSMIEDRYPAYLSRHRRLRSAHSLASTVWLAVAHAVSQFGFNMPFPVLFVCRTNTSSKELATSISRGEVTEICIGGDILGAVLPVPPAIQPNRPGVVIDDERVFSLGFGADSGITPPTTRAELNALSNRLTAGEPGGAGQSGAYTPFETPRQMGFTIEHRPAMAA